MKFKLMATVLGVLLSFLGIAHASEGHKHAEHKEPLVDKMKSELPNVGNKICPVSGQKIGGAMGEGIEVEYEGKLYNLCCAMCAKDFKKDPVKYIEIINDELKEMNQDHEEHNH